MFRPAASWPEWATLRVQAQKPRIFGTTWTNDKPYYYEEDGIASIILRKFAGSSDRIILAISKPQ